MARRKTITITKADHQRLTSVLESDLTATFSDQPYVRSLREKLDQARIVHCEEVPLDVVTMNSTIRLRHTKDREEEIYTLVYPWDANIVDGKLSVLAPTGTAVLGYRVGDSVKWAAPNGTISVRIQELLVQPQRQAVPA